MAMTGAGNGSGDAGEYSSTTGKTGIGKLSAFGFAMHGCSQSSSHAIVGTGESALSITPCELADDIGDGGAGEGGCEMIGSNSQGSFSDSGSLSASIGLTRFGADFFF